MTIESPECASRELNKLLTTVATHESVSDSGFLELNLHEFPTAVDLEDRAIERIAHHCTDLEKLQLIFMQDTS